MAALDPVESAVRRLAPSLDADGFKLTAIGLDDDGTARVRLEARPDACHDCLVPDALLRSVLRQAIVDGGGRVTDVAIEKAGLW